MILSFKNIIKKKRVCFLSLLLLFFFIFFFKCIFNLHQYILWCFPSYFHLFSISKIQKRIQFNFINDANVLSTTRQAFFYQSLHRIWSTQFSFLIEKSYSTTKFIFLYEYQQIFSIMLTHYLRWFPWYFLNSSSVLNDRFKRKKEEKIKYQISF